MKRVIVVGDLMADVVATAAAPVAHASDTPAQIRSTPGGGAPTSPRGSPTMASRCCSWPARATTPPVAPRSKD